MLTGRRRQVALLLGLVAVNGLLGWQARRQWAAYQSRTQWITAGAVAEPASAGPPELASTLILSFADIVDRNLFNPERNNAPPQSGGRAELPILYGTMSLGADWFALMAPATQAGSGAFKRVFAGEEIDGYKLVSVAGSSVVVERGGERFTIEVSYSVAQALQGPGPETTPRPAAGAPAPGGRVSTAVPAPPPAVTPAVNPAGYGAPPGAPVDAPVGTVFKGKKKVRGTNPMGPRFLWVDAPQPEGSAPKEDKGKEM